MMFSNDSVLSPQPISSFHTHTHTQNYKGYYVKTSTGQSAFGVYLYHDEDCWLVGRTPIPGEERLRSPSRSKTPPSSGWEFIDDDDEWQDDLTLTVIPCEIVLSLWMVI